MLDTPTVVPFGITPFGEKVSLITLKNKSLSCEVITYGATIRSLMVPDRNGTPVDVVLGYDTLEEYRTKPGYLGATVGRFANRISHGHFSLNETEYQLACNDGKNHLHGGEVGFSHRVWNIESIQPDSVTLSLISPDGEEGYPGTLAAKVTYFLLGTSFIILYEATCDKDTICSLSNHSYFNLAGHHSGSVLSQEISIIADYFTPNAPSNIPTGKLEPVQNTPMDLRIPVPIGNRINNPFSQLVQSHGFDHNYVIHKGAGLFHTAAYANCDKTGISMSVSTTLPGIQFYTANFINDGHIGKGGCLYGPRHAFCLEAQHFPDAPNHPDFPSAVLKAGEIYDHITSLTFSNFS